MALAHHATYSIKTTVTTWTITGVSLPAGRYLLCIGGHRATGGAQRTVSSITHPAITSASLVQTDQATPELARTWYQGTYRDVYLEVWEVVSSGGTGDLVITWSANVYSSAVEIYQSDGVGPCIKIGFAAQDENSSDIVTSVTDPGAQFGLSPLYAFLTSSSGTISVSPWSTGYSISSTTANPRGAAVVNNSTTGTTVTWSNTVWWSPGVAGILLFTAPPTIDAALTAQAATADGEIITHLVDAALQADRATTSADLAALIALQAALSAQDGSTSGGIDHVEGIAALPAADPATAAAQLASPLGLQAALAARRAEMSAIVSPAGTLTWPSSLPPPEARPFAFSARPDVARGRTELGPGPGHRLTAETGERQRVQLTLDVSQVATFEAFWQSTGYGALPFLGPRHVDDTQIQLVFASDPVIESREGGKYWRISFELERQWP